MTTRNTGIESRPGIRGEQTLWNAGACDRFIMSMIQQRLPGVEPVEAGGTEQGEYHDEVERIKITNALTRLPNEIKLAHTHTHRRYHDARTS
jgi:hypothetical protein